VEIFKQAQSSHQVFGNLGPVEFSADEGKRVGFVGQELPPAQLYLP